MKVKAVSKRVGVSAIKARVIADSIRGMNAIDAAATLTYVSKGAALPVKKVIESAIANAKNNYNLNESALIISEIRVDKGPIANFNAKRFITLGKGGYARFDRKYCHITVVLDDRQGDTSSKESAKAKKKIEVPAVTEEIKQEEKVVSKPVKKSAKKPSAKKKE